MNHFSKKIINFSIPYLFVHDDIHMPITSFTWLAHYFSPFRMSLEVRETQESYLNFLVHLLINNFLASNRGRILISGIVLAGSFLH